MRQKSLRVAFVVFAFLTPAAPVVVKAQNLEEPTHEVIYGNDDRLDLFQVKDTKVLRLADSTVALFQANDVQLATGPLRAVLNTSSYSQEYGLCKEEPFYNQRTGAFCSGSLVSYNIVMTAGHCIPSASACAKTKFVFGFGIKREGKLPESVPLTEVYGCAGLLARDQENSGVDWALLRLDRPVMNHEPLALNRTGAIAKGAPLFVIGHPAGLPTKVAGGASVRDPTPQGYFIANLDTYGGNSGSAVFNAKTFLIEGILVRGEMDYVSRGGCRVSYVCGDQECRGEDVTKISAVAGRIPVLPHFPLPEFPGYFSLMKQPATAAPRLAHVKTMLEGKMDSFFGELKIGGDPNKAYNFR